MTQHPRRAPVHADGPRVLLHGAYGNGNAGDDAILLSLVSGLRAAVPRVRLTVLSDNPALTRAVLGDRAAVRVVNGGLRRARHVWANLRLAWSADLYVFGGGGLMGNMLSSLMLGVLARTCLCRLRGGRAMVGAVGVDPITLPVPLWTARAIGRVANVVTVRDETSRNHLLAAGLSPRKVICTADPVFLLPPDPQEEKEQETSPERSGIRIGLSVTHNIGEALQNTLAQAADMAAERLGAQIVFVPFERAGDLPTSREVAARMRHAAEVVSGELSAAQLRAEMGTLDLMVSMRYHGLLLAAASGLPVVAVSFAPKTYSLMLDLGQDARVFLCGWLARERSRPDFTAPQLADAIVAAWEERDKIRPVLRARALDLQARSRQTLALAAALLPPALTSPTPAAPAPLPAANAESEEKGREQETGRMTEFRNQANEEMMRFPALKRREA